MGYVQVRLHDSALRSMRNLMRILLILPPRPHLHLKLLYNGVLLVYLALILRWRFAFNYNVSYDHLHDHLSRVLDLVNFVALVVGHGIVHMELLWNNHSDKIEQQFLQMRSVLAEGLGRKVNLRRIRLNCNIVFCLLFLRVIVLLGMTIYNHLTTRTSLLLICNFYSELVVILRCSEFTLHSALVLGVYQELYDAGTSIIAELEAAHFKMWSKRHLPLQRIATLQRVHLLLWSTQRDIEQYFGRSLVVVMLKYFIDTSVLPYWAYLNKIHAGNIPMEIWCTSEEFGKLIEIWIPCWICTHCDQLQRQFRSLFHGISLDRNNEQLNSALLSISAHFGQESCQLSIAGLMTVNNAMLGKFLFGVVSYIFICIQFRITYTIKISDGEAEATLGPQIHNHTT